MKEMGKGDRTTGEDRWGVRKTQNWDLSKRPASRKNEASFLGTGLHRVKREICFRFKNKEEKKSGHEQGGVTQSDHRSLNQSKKTRQARAHRTT